MSEYKTPGVHIVEKTAFPNSVVEVATAIPAFVGCTEKAMKGSQSLVNVPHRISSMLEFEKYFGGPSSMQYDLFDKDALSLFFTTHFRNALPPQFEADGVPKEDYESLVKSKDAYLKELMDMPTDLVLGNESCCMCSSTVLFTLYQHIKLFFANGGGSCYIVSVGGYTDMTKEIFVTGIKTLEKEQEPTLLVIPEAVNLSKDECYNVYQEMLSHCEKMKNRFAILDVYEGFKSMQDVITDFRTRIGSNFLSLGSSYYPWLNTSTLDIRASKEMITTDSIWYLMVQKDFFKEPDELKLKDRFLLHYFYAVIDRIKGIQSADKIKSVVSYCIGCQNEEVKAKVTETGTARFEAFKNRSNEILTILTDDEKRSWLSKWWGNSINEEIILKGVRKVVNRLPSSAAMAGIYTMVDNTRGVWKAPANVSLNMVLSPTVDISDDEQKELNAPSGEGSKAINAIRNLSGVGTKVWGARTLASNDLDWRYINVRRTMIFLEESIKNAARSYVFEANDANTWLNLKCMIENFLRDFWKRGGLVGTSPEEAYSVHVGLGETMTPNDILAGVMRIVVLVAISHPAEFIEITFQQQMQKNG